VDADAVALLMVLTRAEFPKEIEAVGGHIVKDEQGVPAVLAAGGVLTDDDGADGLSDADHAGGRLGDVDALGRRARVTPGLIEVLEVCSGQALPGAHGGGASGCPDEEDGRALTIESSKRGVAMGRACIEDEAELLGTGACADCTDKVGRDRGERSFGSRAHQQQEATCGGPVQEEQLLAAHVLVADGVKALLDAEFPRESRHDVLVEAQRHDLIAQPRPGLGRSREGIDAAGGDGADKPPKPVA